MSIKAPVAPEAPKPLSFTASTKAFLDAINAVLPYCGTRTSIPVLKGVRITATQGENIELTATDMSSCVTAYLWGKVESGGSIVVMGKDLKAAVQGNLATTPVTFKLDESNAKAEVKGMTTVVLDTLPASDFPITPEAHSDSGRSVLLEGASFREALDFTMGSVSTDETRPVLATLNLHLREGQMQLQATDSYRLAVAGVQVVGGTLPDGDYMLPGAFLRQFHKQAGKLTGGQVTLDFSGTLCTIEGNGIQWISHVVDGQYPKVEQLVPTATGCTIFVVLNKTDIEPVLKNIVKASGKSSNSPVRVRLDDTTEMGPLGQQAAATLTYDRQDGPTITATIPAFTYKPESPAAPVPFEIGFNPQFMAEVCACKRQVAIAAISPLRPARIVVDEDYTKMKLLMPIRLPD